MASPDYPIASACSLSLLLCAAMGGCRNESVPAEVTILVSGDTNGWITPCGCASNQSGGLPRRAELVRQIGAGEPIVLVDVGGAPGGTSPYDRLKFEAILRGEKAMGIDGHNIGHAEAMLGADALRDLEQRTGVPWLSANVSDLSGKPIGERVRVVGYRGRRVALVGVLDPAFAGETVSVAPVVPSVLDALDHVKGSYDSVVVLAYLQEETLRETAATLPEADVVVGGPTGQPVPPTQIGPTLLTSATNQGKFVVRLDSPALGQRWQGEIIELNETFADDPGQLENVKRYYEELAQRCFTARETSFVAPGKLAKAGGEVAGSKQCESCHEDEYEIWSDSNHAHAWESLEEKSAHVDPDCQRCHTTGYGMNGGYDGLGTKSDRVNVGCECCHGPSLPHVLEPETPTSWVDRAADICSTCHDLENSPSFGYDVYWPKIAHGDLADGDMPEGAK